MTVLPRYRLSDAEKDALLVEQAALIERMAARIAELEGLVGKPKKTSANSHIPPSQDGHDRRVPPTNNGSEREIRPSVIFRKVTNSFRSTWGPDGYSMSAIDPSPGPPTCKDSPPGTPSAPYASSERRLGKVGSGV